ncbi:MAG TPA: Bipolar DNA helicase [Flavobacterium sp.]|nr:Bipolar DNA helicase [Flavobacterium sp.]
METSKTEINAVVTGVFPNKVKIEIKNIEPFKDVDEKLSVGSYLRISDSDDCAIIAVVENFCIEKKDEKDERRYILEAIPIGFLDHNGKFIRGGNNISIPPIGVKPAKKEEIQNIYSQIKKEKTFCFSKLVQDSSIFVPVDGDRFFNKHLAIVGSTGSGKSHTLATILQKAIKTKEDSYEGLNNSHIIVFDLHGEYKTAFPEANHLNVDKFILPYWLMNGDELEELFVEAGDNQAYNQISLFRRIITRNKQKINNNENILFDTPVEFSIRQALNCILNLSKETRKSKDPSCICIRDKNRSFNSDEEKFDCYFECEHRYEELEDRKVSRGTYKDGSLEKFISRIKNKITDGRLKFLQLDENEEKAITFEDTLRQFLGYKINNEANVTIIDLSGVPFEVLSITVSLISRLIFEYGYYFKRRLNEDSNKTPILLVYEEAHKYVPKVKSSKYNSSRVAIERIAKEGRKYGVTLVLVTQRPSEISETIFSQCNNFVVMRLTNPDDQNYVKRLLPDNLGPLTESLPILESGEAILIGDALIMPSLVKIEKCDFEPSSNDINYIQEWKKKWMEVDFNNIIDTWLK